MVKSKTVTTAVTTTLTSINMSTPTSGITLVIVSAHTRANTSLITSTTKSTRAPSNTPTLMIAPSHISDITSKSYDNVTANSRVITTAINTVTFTPVSMSTVTSISTPSNLLKNTRSRSPDSTSTTAQGCKQLLLKIVVHVGILLIIMF